MPTFSGQSPATATDGVSIQNASGLIAQKSETLAGPVITSDFTTTSTSLVDVTGMTITLAATNNVATEITVRIAFSGTGVSSTCAFSLVSTATKEYVWLAFTDLANNVWANSRNADLSGVSYGGSTAIKPCFLDGQVSGTTSGVVVKVQASTAAQTLTIKVGSVIYGSF